MNNITAFIEKDNQFYFISKAPSEQIVAFAKQRLSDLEIDMIMAKEIIYKNINNIPDSWKYLEELE